MFFINCLILVFLGIPKETSNRSILGFRFHPRPQVSRCQNHFHSKTKTTNHILLGRKFLLASLQSVGGTDQQNLIGLL